MLVHGRSGEYRGDADIEPALSAPGRKQSNDALEPSKGRGRYDLENTKRIA
jgi:hypothetical protein